MAKEALSGNDLQTAGRGRADVQQEYDKHDSKSSTSQHAHGRCEFAHGVSPDPKPLHRATALRKDRICQKCAALHLNQATSMAHPQCLYSIIYSQKLCDVSCRVAEQQKQWYMYTPLCMHMLATRCCCMSVLQKLVSYCQPHCLGCVDVHVHGHAMESYLEGMVGQHDLEQSQEWHF